MPNFNLTISPAQIEFILKPGVGLIQTYQITNSSDSNLTLSTEVLPWIPLGSNGDVSYDHILASPNIHFHINNADLKLSQTFTLRPQETKQLVLKINTDSNTPLGDYYYTFFVSQTNQNSSDGNSSQAYGKIGSHLLLSISQTESPIPQSQIKNFQITPKIKDIFFTPLKFFANINNNSDYFFKTSGTLTLTKNNLTIKELKLKNDNVLAHHARTLECQDINTCTISPPFWPGHYTATLTLDSSLNATPISISFFVFPFSPIIGILFLTLIFLVFRKIKKPVTNNP